MMDYPNGGNDDIVFDVLDLSAMASIRILSLFPDSDLSEELRIVFFLQRELFKIMKYECDCDSDSLIKLKNYYKRLADWGLDCSISKKNSRPFPEKPKGEKECIQ